MKKTELEFKAKVAWLKFRHSRIGVVLKELKEEILDITWSEAVFVTLANLGLIASMVFYQSHKKETIPPFIDFYVPRSLPANIDPRVINVWNKGDLTVFSEDKMVANQVTELRDDKLINDWEVVPQYWETRTTLLEDKKMLEITYSVNGREHSTTFLIEDICYPEREGYGGMLEITETGWSFNEEACGITLQPDRPEGQKGGRSATENSMQLDYYPPLEGRYRS